MDNKEFLKEYLNAYSPVGNEFEGQKIWLNYIKNYTDKSFVDIHGSACAILASENSNYNVVIEAHCDEIAWQISNIESDGFIRVCRVGGSDNMIASSKTVVIHTDNNEKIKGVFGSPAVHVRKSYTEMSPTVDELWIDIGLDSKDDVLLKGIEVGNLVTFDDQFHELENYYVGRSLDNKIGGYIIAEVARYINKYEIKLPFNLIFVNAVQEEVGLYGASLIAKQLKPDLALVHDVTHNTNTPKMNKSKDGDIKGGKGPVIEYSSQNHKDLIKLVKQTAIDKNIDIQLSTGSYGNDTVSFFLENIPTMILSTPLKYMHTTVEMAHKEDVSSAIELFILSLQNISLNFIDDIKNPTYKYFL